MESKFTERLILLREEHNYKQKDICDKLHFSYKQYNNWERGRAEPDIDSLLTIASFYHTTVDYLLGASDDKNSDYIKNLILQLDDSQRNAILVTATVFIAHNKGKK